MEVFAAVNAAITGVMVGLYFQDLANRQAIRKQLLDELEATRRLLSTVNEAHNQITETVRKLTDRIAAFDLGAFRK